MNWTKKKIKKERIEKKHLQRRYDEEKQLETMKIELWQISERKMEGNSGKYLRENPVKVKPPKLIS